MNNTEWSPGDIHMAIVGLNIILGSSAMLLNFLLLLVLYCDPIKKFRTPGTVLVTNLAITDGLTGLFLVLRMVFTLSGYYQTMTYFYYSTSSTMQSSLFTVLFITGERFFAVAYPVGFKVHVTKLRMFLLSLVGWVVPPILLNLSVITGDGSKYRISFLTFASLNFLLISLIIAGYCRVYKLLKQQEINMGRYGEPCGTPRNQSIKRKRITLTENKRLTKTFLVITIILMITVLPMIFLTSIIALCSTECATMAIKAYFLLEPVLLINFNVNPLVYAFRLPTYRQAFLTVFRCRKNANAVQPEVIEIR
jgi:hypothetical protein